MHVSPPPYPAELRPAVASLLGLDKDSDADRSVLVSKLLGHAPLRGHLTRQREQCEEVVQRYSTAGLLRPSAASSSGGGSGGGSTRAEWSLDAVLEFSQYR